MKKKALLSSILTIVLCISLIAGSTFALFTNESKVNIAVTAGKVSVEASIELESLYSPKKIGTDGTIIDDTNAANNAADPKTFALGGTATLEGSKLTLTNVMPGDKALFKIKIANNSNVAAKYRTVITVVDDDGLAEVLEFNIGGEEAAGETEWKPLTDDVSLDCYVMLPTTAGNGYKNKTCTVSFTVEAVQGNTAVQPKESVTATFDKALFGTGSYQLMVASGVVSANTLRAVGGNYTDSVTFDGANAVTANLYLGSFFVKDGENYYELTISKDEKENVVVSKAKVVFIDDIDDLKALRDSVNSGDNYRGQHIYLTANIDLNNENWTPMGSTEHPFDARIFNGQNFTISNLKVNGGATTPVDVNAVNQGLIGYTWTNGNIIEIKNLNIHNADVYAKNSAGAIVGQVMTDQSSYWLAGYTAFHHINLTGKVTIEGGNSGGISGSGTGDWALQTQYSDIVINVDAGSYVSNVKAAEPSGEGVGGVLGSVAPIVAWGRVVNNIKSNLDVTGISGIVGGMVGIGNQYFENLTYTGNVTVKNVTPEESGKYNIALITGILAPTWNKSDMPDERINSISATGTLTIELTDSTTIHDNGQGNDCKFGDWAW